jgi:hypothetical protein
MHWKDWDNKMKRKRLIKYLYKVVIALLLFTPPLSAKEAGKTTANFLLLPQSVKAIGMGDAGVATPLGASSIFYNPALLALPKEGVRTSFMYSSYIVDTSFGNAALSYSTPSFTVGAGFLYLRHAKIQGYDASANPIGMYEAEDLCAAISFSKELFEAFLIGASAKWVQSKIEKERAGALCFDIGALFCTPFLDIGVALQHQGDALKFMKEESPLPAIIRCGVSTNISKNFTISVDTIFPKHGERSIFAGGELSLGNIALRAGYKDTSEFEKHISLGVGFWSKRWKMDVAFSPTEELGNIYYISFTLRK